MTEFAEFAKIARLSRECVITEKIDGTNAQVHVLEDGTVLAGSRNRYVTPEADNFGFARWVGEHEEELRSGLGLGRHFGEWWGAGIQRGYGLGAKGGQGEKRFSLFNTSRWVETWRGETRAPLAEKQQYAPPCCHVVPVLYAGIFRTEHVYMVLDDLDTNGSAAAPGFMKPEGVVIYHVAANVYFKKTLLKDEEPKSKSHDRLGLAQPEEDGLWVDPLQPHPPRPAA